MRLIIACLILIFATSAEARQKVHPSCNILWPCDLSYQNNFLAGIRSIKITMHKERKHKVEARSIVRTITASVNGIVSPLANKVAEIQSACGSKVISAVRHTYIAGTRRISLHASGKAVDMSGNPSCIYGHLAGWAGGYSTDYGRMAHVHISYDPDGGREMGARFVHGGGRIRYARHRHPRYASAG